MNTKEKKLSKKEIHEICKDCHCYAEYLCDIDFQDVCFPLYKKGYKAGRKDMAKELKNELNEKCYAIKANDKTPIYGYSKGKRDKNNRGELPPMAQCWKTPRELADDIMKMLGEDKDE